MTDEREIDEHLVAVLNQWWCYTDELFFEVDGAAPAPSHP